jgi:predicted  nucleic acid-binding Zn-ribbon protein
MNIERYIGLHNEVMTRLENGEITVEQAKEVNDLAFNKYIVESGNTGLSDDEKKNLKKRYDELQKEFDKCNEKLRSINDESDSEYIKINKRAHEITKEQKEIRKKLDGGHVFIPKDV